MSSVLASSQGLVDDDQGFGSFELDALFQGNQPLDVVQQALAIEFLHRSEQIQLERLQCITDGALLAAEQVQDVRLDLLEKGPEVSTQSVIVDLFIGLLLDSSLPGILMKGFANSVSKRMVRRYSLLLEGERSKAAVLLKDPKFIAKLYLREPNRSQNIKIIEDMLSKELKADEYMRAADSWRNLAKVASNSDRIKDATAFLKAGHKASKSNIDRKPLKIDGDTPGVSLLGAVQDFTANARLLVRFQYERMETVIKISGMSGEQVRDFLRLAEFEPIEGTLKTIRDRCKLLFEGIIWAGLFKFDTNNRKLRNDRLNGIDKRLTDYWLQRFGGEIQRWVGELGPQGRRNEGQSAIADWNKITYIEQLGSLERYFIKLLNELPQTLADAKALASNFKN